MINCIFTLEEHLLYFIHLGMQYRSPFHSKGKASRRNLTVACTIIRPHVTAVGENIAGSDIDIMMELSQSLGFSAKFISTNSFGGMIEAVSSGEADMSISQAALALSRYRLGTDVLAVMGRKYMLVQRYPVQINKIHTIMQPLTFTVWLAIFTSGLSVAFFLLLLNRYGTVYKKVDKVTSNKVTNA